MIAICPTCKKQVQVTKHNKLAPHTWITDRGKSRCPGSGGYVEKQPDPKLNK